ncbi:MAG TPA: hypothetical protein PK606_11045 [Ottowia sp.]|uniref:hypothetical protein n=1 Tax=Ottowia sp. TaxID=1898956 RepID=UPI002CD7AD8F|nr:hypothetical protein [Ottowia sp.]HRQ03377.1 hypothetical protein [Ottowia sp.]
MFERIVKTAPIEAQSADVASATASICNDEWCRFGATSGHGGFVHTFSGIAPGAHHARSPTDARDCPVQHDHIIPYCKTCSLRCEKYDCCSAAIFLDMENVFPYEEIDHPSY